MSVLYGIKKKMKHNPLFWRYVLNFKPTLQYMLSSKGKQPAHISKIVKSMYEKGIAFSTVEELVLDKALFTELLNEVQRLEENKKNEISQARAEADSKTEVNDKTFMVFLLEREFDPKSVFARFALQDSFRAIADQYFKMKAELRYYDIWHTIPFKGKARTSQLWHRDREDLQILKVFVYLTDVTEEAGPLTYAPGTHILGNNHTEPEYFMEEGVKRTLDEQMAKVVPADKWVVAEVPKYTVVFADTYGYHKGGLARSKDRLLYTFMFNSPACERHRFTNWKQAKQM